jgi:hypothetical protein
VMEKVFKKYKRITMRCVVVILMLTTNIANGQTMDSTIQKLIDVKLIEKNHIKDFKELLNRAETYLYYGERSGADYIAALLQSEFKKLTGSYPSVPIILFDKVKPEADKQEKISQELLNYLTKLKTCGLVTEKQFNEQSEKIKKSSYADTLEFLCDLFNQSRYEEWLRPVRIIRYGEELLSNNVITEQSFEVLKNDANAGKIKSHRQIVDYCKYAWLLDLAKYGDDPAVYLEQIHREIATLLPELNFTNFKYKIEVDSSEKYVAYKLITSIDANGKTYKQRSFISPNRTKENDDYSRKIGDAFHQIFNKILTDNQSLLRLHQIRGNFQYEKEANFGVIALAENQTKMFRYADSYIQVSYENFENTLTSSRIDTAINAYQQIGLLAHLTQSQIDKGKERVQEQENRNCNDVLECFPNVVYSFETKFFDSEDSYATLIREYARISHDRFNPTNITDDFNIREIKKSTLKFSFNGKDYRKVFKSDSRWMDMSFFDFVKSVVADNKLDGQFYDLYADDGIKVIYLTKEQYDYLRTNNRLIFMDKR